MGKRWFDLEKHNLKLSKHRNYKLAIFSNWKNDKQMYQIAIRGLFHQGLIGEALCVFKEGADRNVLKYLSSTNGPYSMDLHLFDHSTAVVAVLHNLRVLCDVIRARVEYKIPTLWIITGRGKHVQKDGQGRLLKDVLPEMLKEERMFNPPLEYHVPHWNPKIALKM